MKQFLKSPSEIKATADSAATRSAEEPGKAVGLSNSIVHQSVANVALIECLRQFARRGRELRAASATEAANPMPDGADQVEGQPDD